MKQSQLFTRTRKEAPAGEVSKNAQLLVRAGFIHKEMAGVYTFLPLGLRVLNNIARIVREEMNKAGGEELQMTVLQNSEVWDKTGRWNSDAVDVWFKTQLNGGGELGLGFTHEEALTNIMKDHVSSYRDLPRYVYQIQTKFRNEERAKSGVLRGREFLMKDLYSFSRTQEEHDAFYEKMKDAYKEVFKRVGIGAETLLTFASGGSFSKYSHEFQCVSPVGEDTIYVDEEKNLAVNQEVLEDSVLAELGMKREKLVEKQAIEVGNIFSLGTRFSEPFNLTYKDEQGVEQTVIMGCYGIGVSRLMGVVVEMFADENGLVWNKEIAPFGVHLIAVGGSEEVKKHAGALYEKLTAQGVEVLYDDREAPAGEKFADADLIGIPLRVVVSEKTLANNAVEVKERTSGQAEIISEEELFKRI